MSNEIRVQVSAGRHTRQWCPVCVTVPVQLRPSAVVVMRDALGNKTPAQVVTSCSAGHAIGEGSHVAWLVNDLPALGTREYVLETLPGEAQDVVALTDDGTGKVAVTVAGEPFTTYVYHGNPVRPCFFPLLGPGGVRVTRSWPMADDVEGEPHDHIHHRSMWIAHGDVNGVDGWAEEGENYGYQIHQGFTQMSGGPVAGVLEAKTDWTDHSRKKVCEDLRRLTIYAQPDGNRLYELTVTLTASEGDLKLGDTKEGGLIAFRVAPAMDGSHTGVITNSYGGQMEGECWGKRAAWCDYSGVVDGSQVGITVMDHPSTFRYPTYWHVRNYGMYTANPFGLRDFHNDPSQDGGHLLPAGQSLFFRYRVYIHRGDAALARVAERYHDFISPPRVKVLPAA